MKSVIIVDDFYANPDDVRYTALNAEYETADGKNWPGKDSLYEFKPQNVVDDISTIVGEPLITKPINKCGHFRMTKLGEHGSQDVHFDPNPGLVWVGVCYLTPTEELQGGTKFWRHKEYGWEETPSFEEGSRYGITDTQKMKNFFETDGKDRDKWIEILNIPFKYNRLVMFRPWKFHSNGEWFGTDEQTARLVQLFFFHTPININE